MVLKKHFKELVNRFFREQYDETPEGVILRGGVRFDGRYITSINGGDEQIDYNMLPAQAIKYILEAALGSGSKLQDFYLAPFSGNVTPTSSWTAANFHSVASEITSTTEGYSSVSRPRWNCGDADLSTGLIGNLTDRAIFPIVCSSTINIAGAGLLSSNTRGGTSGVLASAARYASVRTVNHGDDFGIGYEVGLTDS